MLKTAEDEFRKVCEVFGFDSVNKHQEEVLRFVFESKNDVCVNLQLELESLLHFRLCSLCILVWIQLVRRTLYFDVLAVSPLINLKKDQASRLNSRRISAILYSVMSAPC